MSDHAHAHAPQRPQVIKTIAVDGVYNYASTILNDGRLLLKLKVAIGEGDDPRILRCWKVMLLYFCASACDNYAKEAIKLLALVNAP